MVTIQVYITLKFICICVNTYIYIFFNISNDWHHYNHGSSEHLKSCFFILFFIFLSFTYFLTNTIILGHSSLNLLCLHSTFFSNKFRFKDYLIHDRSTFWHILIISLISACHPKPLYYVTLVFQMLVVMGEGM